jgi:adenylate cyclase
MTTGAAERIRYERVVVLVSDIRSYTPMRESLPEDYFSCFIKDWFCACAEIIQGNGGNIDRFLGDAVLAYWVVERKSDPSKEINEALEASRSLVGSAGDFSTRLSGNFPAYVFRIGVGLSMGDALLGNVGPAGYQSLAISGDVVNLAFRIESLTKEKQTPVIASGNIAECADKVFRFRDLGQLRVEGRKEPVPISELVLG